jgi:hypothetical protein
LEKNVEKSGVKKKVDKWLGEVKSVENCCICSCETTWTNHYDGPIRNIKQQLEHIYYTLFCRCTAICQPPQPVQLCWAKTIFVSQISIFWIFFIQFYFAGSHTEQGRSPCLTLLHLLFQGGICTFCVHQYGFCACWVLTFIWELYYRAFHYFSVQASGF